MAYVQIPKDLKKVKTKLMFNLTKRQLIGFCIAGLVGIPCYLFTRQYFTNDIAITLMIILAFPILFITFYEKDGLPCEAYLKYMYMSKYQQPKVRLSKKKLRERKEAKKLEQSKANRTKKDTKTKGA